MLLGVSCKAQDAEKLADIGLVASVTVVGEDSTPDAVARWNGDVFVGWGDTRVVAEVFLSSTGLPVFSRSVEAERSLVFVRSTDFRWEGVPGDAMPSQAAALFRPAEIQALGLTFQAPQP